MTRTLLVCLLLWWPAGANGDQAPSADVEAHLRQATQDLLDAIAPGRVEVWRTLLHDSMIHVDENGIVRGKSELLKELTPLPAGLEGSIRVASFRLALHGDLAVATHEDHERLDYFGQRVATRFRTTDTWLETPAGWRLIASHVMAVLDDPPAARLTAEQLCAYAGTYALTAQISTRITCGSGQLISERTGRAATTYRPETADVFFAPGQPRTRRIFQRDATGAVTGFVDRREGHDIRWRKGVEER